MTAALMLDDLLDREPLIDAYESEPGGWKNCPSCGALVRRASQHSCARFLAYRSRPRRYSDTGLLDDPDEIAAEIAARTCRSLSLSGPIPPERGKTSRR